MRSNVSLASLTTFEVGGPARWLVSCADSGEVITALAWAREHEIPVLVLGGGSNTLVADAGFNGLVLRMTARDLEIEDLDAQTARLCAGAGLPWDEVVATAVEQGLAGLECLSGIPGLCGAAPIQNIGAYGQEVAESLVSVRVVDRASGEVLDLSAADCGFAYRWSRFKGDWRDRFVILRIELRLRRGPASAPRYGELRSRLEAASPSRLNLKDVRQAVLDLRREKSMVLDPLDVNRRSAGSFFLNPRVTAEQADEVEARAKARGSQRPLPRFPADSGVKLPAAWLIEEAGFARGYGHGPVGLSSRHCLAVINRGGARAEQLVELAAELRRAVREIFGVVLVPEPVFVGFDRSVEELLD